MGGDEAMLCFIVLQLSQRKTNLNQELRKSCVWKDLTSASTTTISKFGGGQWLSVTFWYFSKMTLHCYKALGKPTTPNVFGLGFTATYSSGINGPFLQAYDKICSFMHRTLLCSSGIEGWSVVARKTPTALPYIARSDLPMDRHHKTNLKSIEHDQLCLTPGKFRNKEQLIWSMSGLDRYQPTLILRLLFLQKMLLEYNVGDITDNLWLPQLISKH